MDKVKEVEVFVLTILYWITVERVKPRGSFMVFELPHTLFVCNTSWVRVFQLFGFWRVCRSLCLAFVYFDIRSIVNESLWRFRLLWQRFYFTFLCLKCNCDTWQIPGEVYVKCWDFIYFFSPHLTLITEKMFLICR